MRRTPGTMGERHAKTLESKEDSVARGGRDNRNKASAGRVVRGHVSLGSGLVVKAASNSPFVC